MDFEQAANDLSTLDDNKLAQLASLVQRMRQAQDYVQSLEGDLAKAQENLRKIQEDLIPSLMSSLSIESTTMSDGTVLKVEKFYSPSVTEENKEAFYHWLRENEHGGLIKNVVSVALGRNSDNEQALLLSLLTENGFEPEQKLKIEPMTLKAWVKEQMTNGVELPPSITVFSGQKAKIVPPKKSKRK
jgi:hypothetical protein